MAIENGESTPTPGLSNWAAERQYLGRFYLSQGFTEKKGFTNDCGPSNLAMALNMAMFKVNLGSVQLGVSDVIRSARWLPWERLPGWVPKLGGATAPWGLARAFNRLAEETALGWRAERKNSARRVHIIEALLTGRPVTALKIWKTGGAHWVTLVRYASEKDKLYYLDPNPYLEFLPIGKRLQSQTWAEFEADWSRTSWWTRLLGLRRELVIYSKTN